MIEDSLFGFLSTQSAVAALLGVGVACRIYPCQFPQNPTMPCMMYETISSPRNRTTDGYIMSIPRFQFNIIGASALICSQVASAIESVLDNYKGVMGTEYISAVFLVDGANFYEETGENYERTMDFIIWHKPNT